MKKTKQQNLEGARYLRSIKSALPCYNKAMRKMYSDFKFSVEAYLEEHPDADLVALEERFGTVARIAKDFAGGYSDDYIKSYKLKKRFGVAIVSILALILVAVGILGILIIVNSNHNIIYYYDGGITAGKVLF